MLKDQHVVVVSRPFPQKHQNRKFTNNPSGISPGGNGTTKKQKIGEEKH